MNKETEMTKYGSYKGTILVVVDDGINSNGQPYNIYRKFEKYFTATDLKDATDFFVSIVEEFFDQDLIVSTKLEQVNDVPDFSSDYNVLSGTETEVLNREDGNVS